jgi:hypothetical protein
MGLSWCYKKRGDDDYGLVNKSNENIEEDEQINIKAKNNEIFVRKNSKKKSNTSKNESSSNKINNNNNDNHNINVPEKQPVESFKEFETFSPEAIKQEKIENQKVKKFLN